MKIVNYKKKKNNIYEVTLSNKQKLNLYDDVILKYELLTNKNIEEKELQDILLANSYLESYFVALKYINTKLRTEKEIEKKIENYSKEAKEYTINRLKKEGYLNNELYIKAYINDAINLKIEGPNKIISNLKKLGFREEEILNYLNTFEEIEWLNKIKKYTLKKINSNHNMSGLVLKQKLYKDLLNKGFLEKHIRVIFAELEFSDDINIYEKEYLKIKNKLNKKYSSEELEYRIKNKLYQKGFRK